MCLHTLLALEDAAVRESLAAYRGESEGFLEPESECSIQSGGFLHNNRDVRIISKIGYPNAFSL